jgi:hypothetical protein
MERPKAARGLMSRAYDSRVRGRRTGPCEAAHYPFLAALTQDGAHHLQQVRFSLSGPHSQPSRKDILQRTPLSTRIIRLQITSDRDRAKLH